jgi:transporter family-2 protein
MDLIFWILALGVGLATVVQGGLNKAVSSAVDLNFAILLNSAVVLILSAAVYLGAKLSPQFFPSLLQPQSLDWARMSGLGWKLIVPGICGFTIVMGIPWAISRMGALKVFLLIIVAQILFSALWDFWVEGLPLSPQRLAGALITLSGAILAMRG